MTTRTLAELGDALYGGSEAPAVVPAASPAAPAAATGPRTQAELAEALYGANGTMQPEKTPGERPTAEPAPDTPPAAPRTQEELAEALYAKPEDEPLEPVPDEVKELRDDPARRLYSAQVTFRDDIPDNEFQAEGIDPKVGRKAVRELRELAADIDLTPGDVRTLRQRVAHLQETQPDVISQREATVQALNQEFGNDAKQALRDARALLKRDPRTAKVIDALGLGDDAATVLMVARAARKQRAAGRLKTN